MSRPASELAILGPELAAAPPLRVRSHRPDRGRSGDCAASRSDELQAKAVALAQDDDALAALDRDLAQAESEVAEAERDQRDADAARHQGRGRPGGRGLAGG